MEKFVIVWPSKLLKEQLYKNTLAIFFDDDGWWVYCVDSKVRKLITIDLNSDANHNYPYLPFIRSKLNWWSPVWNRWIGFADEYELLRSHSIFIIAQIYKGIKIFNIKFAIFNTGVPHHYDSSIFSIACEISKIKQVYLYAIFDGSLLPILQDGDIRTRSIINIKINSNTFENGLENFINRLHNNELLPGTRKLKPINSYFYLSILHLLKFLFIKKLSSLKFFLLHLKYKKKTWSQPSDYRFSGHIRIFKNQKEFLSFYTKNQLSTSEIDTLFKDATPKILIAAHYQPEATSFPEGGTYFNHLEIALALRGLDYIDDILYKEHPASWLYTDNIVGPTRVGLWRSVEYLKDLLNVGCKLLPSNFLLSNDIHNNKCFLPITITGTIAIERSLLGLHTIVTGEPWYKGLPGTIRFDEIKSLNIIPREWVEHNKDIAMNAKSFLLDKLSNHTMINQPGIGSGIPLTDSTSKDEFILNYNNLINSLLNPT